MHNARSTACARLSLGTSPQKYFEARPQENQKALTYGTEAGSGSHLANQEASGAGKAFAYGTGAGGRSHLPGYEMARQLELELELILSRWLWRATL